MEGPKRDCADQVPPVRRPRDLDSPPLELDEFGPMEQEPEYESREQGKGVEGDEERMEFAEDDSGFWREPDPFWWDTEDWPGPESRRRKREP